MFIKVLFTLTMLIASVSIAQERSSILQRQADTEFLNSMNVQERIRGTYNRIQKVKQSIQNCSALGGFYAPGHPQANSNNCLTIPTCNAASQKLIFDGTRFICGTDRQ